MVKFGPQTKMPGEIKSAYSFGFHVNAPGFDSSVNTHQQNVSA
jgi:hypothetical protein